MKAKPYQVSALAKQIQHEFKAALVFGTDPGIAREISEKIAGLIVPNIHDPLTVVSITHQKIKEFSGILTDEANAPSLLGGRKLIWVKEAEQTMIDAVEDYINRIQTDAFLLISAGNLSKSAALRQFCETHKSILTIACYPDEAKDVALFIREILAEQGIRVQPNALSMMVERLSENRLTTRRELEKLICYLGNKKEVDDSDVLAVITDTQNASTDKFCCAVATGNREVADKEYKLMLENGENPVSIIRILSLYFNKLLEASDVQQQAGTEAAIKKIMKPAQFRFEHLFRQQVQIWKKTHILKVLGLLIEAEKQVKQTGFPADLILDRVIIQISSVSRRLKM